MSLPLSRPLSAGWVRRAWRCGLAAFPLLEGPGPRLEHPSVLWPDSPVRGRSGPVHHRDSEPGGNHGSTRFASARPDLAQTRRVHRRGGRGVRAHVVLVGGARQLGHGRRAARQPRPADRAVEQVGAVVHRHDAAHAGCDARAHPARPARPGRRADRQRRVAGHRAPERRHAGQAGVSRAAPDRLRRQHVPQRRHRRRAVAGRPRRLGGGPDDPGLPHRRARRREPGRAGIPRGEPARAAGDARRHPCAVRGLCAGRGAPAAPARGRRARRARRAGRRHPRALRGQHAARDRGGSRRPLQRRADARRVRHAAEGALHGHRRGRADRGRLRRHVGAGRSPDQLGAGLHDRLLALRAEVPARPRHAEQRRHASGRSP